MNIQKGPVTVDAGVIATLKDVATKAFAVVEKAWSKLDVTLVDYKVPPKYLIPKIYLFSGRIWSNARGTSNSWWRRW